ncbi:unknown [Crocosphaera subtropica ATCC 51142]|uniref:Glycosyltransferase 2-like domain-containing protein n=1 Tax=Crocosphaera subtropica (strain ATCC 51142 / BH68) TaxID=43989 RepID=B1WP94_CROS5|nr:glycosyltransferase [Crocosphaera subtropica]ACB49876.1 unknown [Crocosphaera subtropica ATCC 51142]
MKVLIADFDLFSKVGGGQTFYRSIIKKNPQIQFYYIAEKEPLNSPRPTNATAIPYKEQFLISDFKNFFEVTPPKWVERAFAMASNIAASAEGQQFDIIDVPDYEQWGIFLRPALKQYGIKFNRIALSMHGKISKTLRLDWFDWGQANIPLDLQEKMQYKVADIRYGISKSYLDEWREDIEELESYYYNPLHFFDLPRPTQCLPSTESPTLNFIGRTEKRKGPDIFIDLVWWLPETSYSKAQIIGPHSYNYNNTKSSQTYLQEMIQHRQSHLRLCPPMKREELTELFASKSLTFLPSRYDTLNLVALESLFSGCPTAVGNGAGVCRFLEETFPEVPFITINIDDIYACLPQLETVLDNYEDYRQHLVDQLSKANLEVSDPNLEDIYNSSSASHLEIQDELAQWYSQLLSYWESGQKGLSLSKIPAVKAVKKQIKAQIKPTYKQLKKTLAETKSKLKQPLEETKTAQTLKSPQLFERYKYTFNASELNQKDLGNKVKECWKLASAFGSEEQGWRDKLKNGYRIDRVRAWREIARLEELRGNELVAATYKLRGLRLLDGDRFGDLPYVLRVLQDKGFTREVEVIDAMYGKTGQREEKCYNFIEKARQDNLHNQAWDYEIFDDRRHKSEYRVSVIVSLYNAAEKLPLFLNTLQHQTLMRSGEGEIILVDSGSPGDEYKVFKQLAEELKLPILYVRSQARETIQTAWNRGISLAKSPYLSFLGVDETILPDALETLADELDKNPDIDWVIGHSLVTNVDKKGNWVNDIMPYDRTPYHQDLVYLETCYLSWVGALYRRSIHDRFGYYDGTFRGAGDTEFKSRLLPHIKSKVIDRTLGVFWNYPDERTTQSPAAEIEDMRAWYVHRTLAGVRYAFAHRTPEELEQLIYLCLAYRKSYCGHTSSDLEYAYNLSLYLKEIHPQSKALQYLKGIETLLQAYRSLDWMPKLSRFSPLAKVLQTRNLAKQIQEEHLATWKEEKSLGLKPDYRIFNDNRHEQHAFLWLTKVEKSES